MSVHNKRRDKRKGQEWFPFVFVHAFHYLSDVNPSADTHIEYDVDYVLPPVDQQDFCHHSRAGQSWHTPLNIGAYHQLSQTHTSWTDTNQNKSPTFRTSFTMITQVTRRRRGGRGEPDYGVVTPLIVGEMSVAGPETRAPMVGARV